LKNYSDKAEATSSGITKGMYLGLRTEQVLSISLLLAMADAQVQKKWKRMRCRNFTVTTQPQEHGQCSATSLRSRAIIRSPEVNCIGNVSPMHYSMVIVMKQGLRVDLIWCDSLQRDERLPLFSYSQYYHFLKMEMNRPQDFHPNRHYTSELRIRTHCPVLPRQCNGTDCGIFTLLYQQTVSNWYGTTAGQAFTDDHIKDLINSLRTINQDTASRHRGWLRIHMHTWWTGNWNGADPDTPPGIHQQQLQR
jgi:hypothetical protein